MDGKNDFSNFMQRIAKRYLDNQELRKGDFIGEDGLLRCGVCGQKRQAYITVAKPLPSDPLHSENLLVATSCRCDEEREVERKRQKRAEKDMEYIEKLRGMSLMDDKFRTSTFDSFVTNRYNERNLKICKRYAEAFDQMVERNQGLLLWGDVGTGKSFSAACIANYLLERKVPVVMTSFVKIIGAIQADSEQEDQIVSKLNRAKLVIFDDLGAERGTSFGIEKVYSIVDSRYRRGLPMILTTNLTMDEMKNDRDIRFSRIYDRIFETCYPMQFLGPSWRRGEARERYNEMSKLLED